LRKLRLATTWLLELLLLLERLLLEWLLLEELLLWEPPALLL
jgi:hypothetical protein